ncbi:MAG: DUF4962 domain-containing protein [Nitrospinae bacterium]|nr:DUF4962 domain-containing protein [Nitrospinota bacterium]
MYRTILYLLFCALAFFPNGVEPAALLRIDHRAPKPDEIGYRPPDGATVRLNPPSLIWLHDTRAGPYSVQWARAEDFSDAVTVHDVPFNTYTHHTPLAAGVYHWRYQFATKDGMNSNWGMIRTFTVPANAVEFPMPTRAQQRERVPKSHPRLFIRPEELPRLRALSQGQEAERFAALRAEADRLLAGEPTPEPQVKASLRDASTRAFWWPNREQTLKACQEAETLAFVYLMTGEKPYGEAARKWILHLASWDPDGPTNFNLNDEAAFPLLHRLPRAYDWAYDALTPAERERVQQVMRRRGRDAWQSPQLGYGVGHLHRPFNSHANRAWHKLGEAAIALYDEIPEAETWLDFAVNKFYAAYPVWSDDDGGWHEGVHYWASYMAKIVWWLHAAQSALGIDGLKKPFFAQVGDFPLYVAPPNAPNSGFGDLSYHRPSRGWGRFMEYFARAIGSRPEGASSHYWRWWMDRWDMTPAGGILGFLYHVALGPLPQPKPPSDLPPSKVFRGIGVASLHTTLLDSTDDVHLLFKSSPFGSQSHGHNPQNAFQLNAYGEELLTTCGYRDWHASPFHAEWCRSTMAHNGVLVSGEGQIKHTAAPGGRIVELRLERAFDYVVGDATAAYAGRLRRYHRHVAFVKPDLIVLYDDLLASEPAMFQFMLHALRPFSVDENNALLSVEQPNAGVAVRYLSPTPLTFRQWNGYEPKPEKAFPTQWHVEASTGEKRGDIGILTLIVPYRMGQRVEWSAERLESDTAIGARVERGGQAVVVAFRKGGVEGAASLAGWTFEGSIVVR